MASTFEKLQTINSVIRTLLGLVVVGGIGTASWYGYQTYTAADKDLENAHKELVAKDQELAESRQQLETSKNEIKQQKEQLKQKDAEIVQKEATSNSISRTVARASSQASRRFVFVSFDDMASPRG